MPISQNEPNLNFIAEGDLRDDERLSLIYIQTLRAGFWSNRNASDVLTFWALAEKALAEATPGTAGRLFYSLVKKKDFSKLTNQHEDRAAKRMNSAYRNELYSRCKGIKPLQRRLPIDDPEEVTSQLFGRNIGYHHGIMVQCFMPQERQEGHLWQSKHGHARLAIQAGLITDPRTGELVQCPLPFGSKARLIIPYINGFAIQRKTNVINMGESLRKFFKTLGIPYGGPTGKAIVEQVNAVAAAQFTLGFWDGKGEQSQTDWARVAKSMSFWIERDPSQGLLWEQEMVLSTDYVDAIKDHRVPIDMEHLVALKSARAQDMYSWFSYRLPKLRKPFNMRYDTLHSVFGQGISDPYLFRQKFRADLLKIANVYDGFRIETPSRKDYVQLQPSKSPVPQKVTKLIK